MLQYSATELMQGSQRLKSAMSLGPITRLKAGQTNKGNVTNASSYFTQRPASCRLLPYSVNAIKTLHAPTNEEAGEGFRIESNGEVPFRNILSANRGEVAIRVFRAETELAFKTATGPVERGVPIMSGTNQAISTPEEAIQIAETYGYPVILKAAMGSSGPGTRVAYNGLDVADKFLHASNEARAAFGDGRIFVERFPEESRQVGIQVERRASVVDDQGGLQASSSTRANVQGYKVEPRASVVDDQEDLQASSSTPAEAQSSGVQEHVPLTDLEIYEEIKSCEEWQDVLDVVVEEIASITSRTGVQALCRISAIVRASADPLMSAKEATRSPGFQTLLLYLSSMVQSMNPLQLSNTLASLSHLDPTSVSASLLARIAAAAAASSTKFYPRDITAILAAFARLRTHPGRSVLDALGYRSAELLNAGKFEPIGVSILLHSLGVLQYHNQVLLRAAASNIAKNSDNFRAQGIANSMWAFGTLGFFSNAAVKKALEHFKRHADSYKPQELCNLLGAMSSLRYYPSEAWQSFLGRTDSLVEVLQPRDIASFLHGCATFNFHPGPKLMARLCARAETILSAFGPVELSNTIWSLGLLNEVKNPLFARIVELLPDHYEQNKLNDALLRQIFQGFLCAKLELGAADTNSFPPLMLDAMKRSWVTSIHTGGTPTHETLGRVLDTLGVRHDAKRPTRDGLVSIDFALKAGPERFVALQVVCEQEHTCNTGALLGSVCFQRRLLEKNGWEVRHLRAKDLALIEPRLQHLFVADLVKGMGVQVGRATGGKQAAGQRMSLDERGATSLMAATYTGPPNVRPSAKRGSR